ncbi:MAG: TolC family protein, partial [Deltaproteobacteria bacterium]|nr:TolC family protein [Deltaproteobacteria bacterium]
MNRTRVLATIALASMASSASAAEPAAVPDASTTSRSAVAGASLARCIELSERNHPNILAERARLSRTRAQLQEARIAPFTQFRATGGFGIAPTVRGDGIFSPNTDQSLTSNMGMAWRF